MKFLYRKGFFWRGGFHKKFTKKEYTTYICRILFKMNKSVDIRREFDILILRGGIRMRNIVKIYEGLREAEEKKVVKKEVIQLGVFRSVAGINAFLRKLSPQDIFKIIDLGDHVNIYYRTIVEEEK